MKIFPSLQEYFSDTLTTEISINPNRQVFITKIGMGTKYLTQLSPQEINLSAKLIADENNGILNRHEFSLKGKLYDYNARVQILHPPIVDAICMSIRFPSKSVITLEQLHEKKFFTTTQIDYIKTSIEQRKNIVIAGATGSGKTTLINSFLHELQESEDRIYIIEDTPELSCKAKNTVSVLCDHYYEPDKAIYDSLRMFPTRIMLGECRTGKAILSLLTAWNTGHEGGLTTLHSSSAEKVSERIIQLAQIDNISINNRFILSTIDIIIYIKNNKKGRFIEKILELHDIDKYDELISKEIK